MVSTVLSSRRLVTTVLLMAACVSAAWAQSPAQVRASETGRIVGRIVDSQTGTGIVGVLLQIGDGGTGAMSGVDGRFVINGVPSGTVSLRAESLGYGTKIVTDIVVPQGGSVEQNVSLEPKAVELAAIEVSAGAERGSVNRALDQQRTASGIVNAITSEQMSRSPDGDAASAMQRVSGVTVQDGKYVFVRGLGERYTTTSLNGARIPSPEPERKTVPLDLFPSGLLQTITTSKTFTPDQPGDFSGAQVDIQTREFPAERQFAYSLSVGYNDLVTGRHAPFAPTIGSEWLGFAGSGRKLPALVRQAGTFEPPPSQTDMNRMVGQFRNAWSSRDGTGTPNASGAVSVGGSDPVFGRRIAYLLSATYSRSDEVQADQVRSQALAGPSGSTMEIDRFQGTTGRSSVLWGGLVNLSTLVGQRSRFAINATYNRTSDNEARTELGASENLGELPLRIERLRFVERSVFSGQLKGEHEVRDNQRADWTITTSGVTRNEPDRSEIVYAIQQNPSTGATLPPAWFSVSNEGAVRTFGELSENSLEGAVNYRIAMGNPANQHILKFGGVLRSTDRDADNRAYSISTGRLDQSAREMAPEHIFDGRYSSDADNVFRITPLSQGGSYSARDRLAAGFVMLDLGVGSRIRVIGGARVEHSSVEVTAQPTIGSAFITEPSYTDVLPALSVNIGLTDRQNLRLSASQTLARPEYRELAGILYREVLGGDNVIGNPDLQRTLIQNLDARWEWYPSGGEVLSLGVFAKNFDNPIERVYLATSGTRIVKFVNASGAKNYGAEIELRKRLGTFSEMLEPFTVFANATVMESDITIGTSAASKTNDRRAMVGQAPWVINAGATYASQSGATSATVLYNVVGERIQSASEAPLPDIYEKARNVLDVSIRLGLTGAISAKIDAKNVLDEPYQVTQGSVVRDYYRAGRQFSIGLSWKR